MCRTPEIPKMIQPKKEGCLIFLLFICAAITAAKDHDNVFNEELVLKELNNDFISSYFQFTTRWNIKTRNDRKYKILCEKRNENLNIFFLVLHTDLLSRSLSELFLHYDINELHVTLSQGMWRHEDWGYPPISAGSGAELYVWFSSDLTQETINQQWIELSEALSGLLCASFSFVEDTNTVSPHFSFRPSSATPNSQSNSSFIRYTTLPNEVVCTENLTP